ncbi:SCO6745 family protein [Gordonia oleivorans]|uniref:SCO6745 family protein n=2 Tax=Gordonia TaxID=2053 RepID=UPI003CCD79A7
MTMSTTTSAARRAYDTLEPFHVLAYFSPALAGAHEATGLNAHAFYVGARAAPMGPCAASVVTAAFVNFAPDSIAKSWAKALEVGLDRVSQARDRMLDEQLRDIWGEGVDDDAIAAAADVFAEAAQTLPYSGRPLAAAWAAAPAPTPPHLRLWHTFAVLREWRGDNHIAALVVHGLGGLDAAVFHEAALPDPTVTRRVLGRDLTLLTRGWSAQEWEESVDRLVAQGLAERTGSDTDPGHRLTSDGAAIYDDIEAQTDALGEQLWSRPELSETVTALRPYVKSVIDAGVLPGTRKK